jgi:hypothetical protein
MGYQLFNKDWAPQIYFYCLPSNKPTVDEGKLLLALFKKKHSSGKCKAFNIFEWTQN